MMPLIILITDLTITGCDFFNPMVQYEQAYMYYRYLTQQLDYKIKCKEFENLCKNSDENSKVNRPK